MNRFAFATLTVIALSVGTASSALALEGHFESAREGTINRLNDRFEDARDGVVNKLTDRFEDARDGVVNKLTDRFEDAYRRNIE